MTVAGAFGSFRLWLDQNLFPQAPKPPRITIRRAAIITGTALLLVAVQLVRIHSSAPLNSLWAEDGYLFLADALRWSFFHALTTPYNGYLNTVSRLIAEPVSKLPVQWFAPAMAVAGAAIVTGCAFVVWRSSAGHIRSTALRGVLVGVLVLPPVVGIEMLDDVTYSIWYLLFASFWVLLWRPSTLAGSFGAGVLLFLTAVSNALTVLLLPIWLLRLIAVRDHRDRVIVAAFAGGILTQYALSWNQTNLLGERGGYQYSQPAHWNWSLVPAYIQRIVGGVLTGQRINSYLWVHFSAGFELLLAGGLALLVVGAMVSSRTVARVLVPSLVALSAGMFLLSGYQRQVGSQFYWSHGSSNVVGSHYMVVPTLLLLSALLLLLDVETPHHKMYLRKELRVGVIALVAVSAAASFSVVDASARGRPTWTQALARGRTQCVQSTRYSVNVQVADYEYLTMPIPCRTIIGAALTTGRRPPPPDPHTTILLPVNFAIVSDERTIAISASDTVQVNRVEVRLSGSGRHGQLLGVALPGAFAWILIWNSRQVPNGTYQLQSVAEDSAGKSARSSTVSIVVSNG